MYPQFLNRIRSPNSVPCWGLVLALWLMLPAGPAGAADVLRVNAFAGATNLALFAGLAKGFIDKCELKVELEFTPNSELQRSGLAAGKFEIAGVDNAVAMNDRATLPAQSLPWTAG